MGSDKDETFLGLACAEQEHAEISAKEDALSWDDYGPFSPSNIKEGDEVWPCNVCLSDTSEDCFGYRYMPIGTDGARHHPIRRKLDTAQSDPGDGYRLLEDHEVIRKGDEFLARESAWRPIGNREFGKTAQRLNVKYGRSPYRRPIRVQSPGWRWLDDGEHTQAGDEYYNCNGDFAAIALGTPTDNNQGYTHTWRRRIPPCKEHDIDGGVCQRCGHSTVAEDTKVAALTIKIADARFWVCPESSYAYSITNTNESVLCGCGMHEIDPAGDVYAQHNNWINRDANAYEATRESRAAAFRSVVTARPTGISARRPLTVFVDVQWEEDV